MSLFRKACDGYVGIADGQRTRLLHTVVAELALGKKLPRGAIVHHVDGDKKNNFSCNLVLCEDQAYHKLLHQRLDALRACGNSGWLKCKFCGQHDSPKNLRIYQTTRAGRKAMCMNIHHKKCNADYLRERYHAQKMEKK